MKIGEFLLRQLETEKTEKMKNTSYIMLMEKYLWFQPINKK